MGQSAQAVRPRVTITGRGSARPPIPFLRMLDSALPHAGALIPMQGLDWFMFAVSVAIGLYLAIFLPKVTRMMWRGEHKWMCEPMPSWWLWGGPLWHGVVRAAVLQGPAALAVIGTLVLGVFVGESSPLAPLAYALLGFASVIMFLLVPPVVLLARPRFLIPPPLRSQPGALKEWIDRLSRGTRGTY